MKVLVISHLYPSICKEKAGIFVYKQIKALIARGVEIQIISAVPWIPFPVNYFNFKWNCYSNISEREIKEEIPIWHPRYFSFPKGYFFSSSGERMYFGIRKTMSKIYQEFHFDLIHAHVALPDGAAGMKIAQKFNKPLLVTIHGQDFQQTIFKNNKCKKNIERTINFSEKTIIVSNKLKRIARTSLQINNNKLVVIPNGINKEDFKKNKQFKIVNLEEKIIILSVSNLIKTKGIDLNIKALKYLKKKYPNILYIVIGAGKVKNKLVKYINKNKLEKYVKFLGQMTNQKVINYISKCNIFSLPSWNESFGIVYLEAMAQGKPVIGCEGEGIEDFVEHGVTGMLVKPKDVDSLVEAIDYLKSNPDKARAIGKRARKLVLENYTWGKNAEKTIQVYEEVLNNGR